jgi:hypothetical protein
MTKPEPAKTKRAVRVCFYGIKKDAATLGIHHDYLYRILKGQRNDPEILKKYQTLRPHAPSTPPELIISPVESALRLYASERAQIAALESRVEAATQELDRAGARDGEAARKAAAEARLELDLAAGRRASLKASAKTAAARALAEYATAVERWNVAVNERIQSIRQDIADFLEPYFKEGGRFSEHSQRKLEEMLKTLSIPAISFLEQYIWPNSDAESQPQRIEMAEAFVSHVRRFAENIDVTIEI